MTTKTYLLFDGSGAMTGTPEEITRTLWQTCHSHTPLNTVQEYMEWQKKTELEWSGETLDTSSYETFIDSLVKVGFLISQPE